jgi:caffeoyl-CoA O-methyltransferase
MTGNLRPITPVGLALAALDDGDIDRAVALLRPLDQYLARCTTANSSELARLARRSDDHGWNPGDTLEAEMLSGHVEGQLLSILVKLSNARRVLDVGTFTGYSALAMAEALHDENVEGGIVVTCELDDGVAAMAADAFADSVAGNRIRLEVGPAIDTIARLAHEGEPFDLVFLDADKPGYLPVLQALFEHGLVEPGALIVADNTLLQGEPYADGARSANGDAIAAFNRAVADDDRVEQVLLPLRDGVSLIRVRSR